MPEKELVIKLYIKEAINKLKTAGIILSQAQVDNALNEYLASNESLDRIKEDIDRKVAELIEITSLQREKTKSKDIRTLPLNNIGITLNNQDIDLLLIASSKNKEQLQSAIAKITNLKGIKFDYSMDFLDLREEVFKTYLEILTPKEEYFRNKEILLTKKIEYLQKNNVLSDEEISFIYNLLLNPLTKKERIEKIREHFDSETVSKIFKTLRNFSPIEKSGIKDTSLEAYQNLTDLLTSFNSITIDEEVKYGSVVLEDDTFDFSHLKKSLDFVRSMDGKKARLNSLFFYMDCPKDLENLEPTPENKKIVKDKLIRYVDEVTKFIKENGYTDTVRSIDVFNELLNRFPMDGDTPYLYRGDINAKTFDDNTASGWFKFLTIEDLCDVAVVARSNLGGIEFTFNDDNLIDSRKVDANIKLIQRIKKYEMEHNVKLIDTIGTQMHINNSVTKEDFIKMFKSLSLLGYPIEVTEFDLAMNSNLSGLTDSQIEQLKERKINELYEVIENLKDECNIKGFTIWSKTDKQNFQLSLENEKRLKMGLEPLKTLHGGMYKENMRPKNETFTKDSSPLYNYHTHTKRCGHASFVNDLDYVKAARLAGITSLGFSDHIPNSSYEVPSINSRMFNSEIDEYIESVRKLQEDNKDMNILCGFEAEYSKDKEGYLGDIRKKVDYLILGQHFIKSGLHNVQKNNNPNYPLEYAKAVCQAMDSGLFDIVVHPDIFMMYRDTLETEEGKKTFLKNAVTASTMIGEKAKELNIPLEINFGKINTNTFLSDEEYSYPHSIFWKVIEELNAPVIYGVDAHHPKNILDRERSRQKIADILKTSRLNFVPINYNPVVARKKNKKLQDLLANNQMNALCYEASYVSAALDSILPKISNSADSNMIVELLNRLVDSKKQALLSRSNIQDETIIKEFEKISQDQSLNQDEKKYKLGRLKLSLSEVNNSMGKHSALLETLKNVINSSKEMNCSNKQEYKEMIVNQVEAIYETNPQKKSAAVLKINNFKESKINAKTQNVEKPKTLKLQNTNKPNNSNSSNRGFIKGISIMFILSGFFGIVYGIYLFIVTL